MHDFRPLIISFWIFFFVPALLRADTLYLKNGQRAEGLITREGSDQIEFELGDASTTFNRSEVDHIERSSPEETADLVARWEKHKKKARDLDLIATEQRKRSLEEWRVRSAAEEAFKKANERERQKIGS